MKNKEIRTQRGPKRTISSTATATAMAETEKFQKFYSLRDVCVCCLDDCKTVPTLCAEWRI